MEASIIIPTKNRAKELAVALRSVINQSLKLSYEIIVVDNGSTDTTKEIVESFFSQVPAHIELSYVYEPMPGLLSGRHKGAKVSKSEILIFIDDDIKADEAWLESIINCFKSRDVQMVGGPSYPMYEVDPPSWTQKLWLRDGSDTYCGYYSLLDFGEIGKSIDPSFIWGLNFSITKKAFQECGGFHPDSVPTNIMKFQGDGETGLTEKLKAKGMLAWYEPKARVGHLVSRERLMMDYVYKRQYFQGVCDSYTLIRKTGEVGMRLKIQHPQYLKRYIKDRLFTIHHSKNRNSLSLENLAKLGYKEGFWFHQKEAAKDKIVKEWIMRTDYWDYRIPNY